MSESFVLTDAERERLLAIRASAEPLNGAEKAKRVMLEWALALHKDNYVGPAAALSRFLLGDESLEQAFGLKRRIQGKPTSADTLKRDVVVLKSRRAGESWSAIKAKIGERHLRDAQKLCAKNKNTEFQRRWNAAVIEILTEPLTLKRE